MKRFAKPGALSDRQKAKVEFLCNECCCFGYRERKQCYEAVSRKVLGEDGPEHRCAAPDAGEGYRFSQTMENPGFIGIRDIVHTVPPIGFHHFKIEGRRLNSAGARVFALLPDETRIPVEGPGGNLSGRYAGSVLSRARFQKNKKRWATCKQPGLFPKQFLLANDDGIISTAE